MIPSKQLLTSIFIFVLNVKYRYTYIRTFVSSSCIFFIVLPKIVRFSAHTSRVAFLQTLITQWYWNTYRWLFDAVLLEQFCWIESQFLFLAAMVHSLAFVGHSSTYLIVSTEASQNVKADAWSKWWIIYII